MARYPQKSLHIVCIGHSFGGLLLRYALSKLEESGALEGVALEVFVTLASPHVGARQLGAVLRIGARILGKVFSTAYEDLLLDSDVVDKTCSATALVPLQRFRHRILYACARGDHLIGFESGALLVPHGGVSVEYLPSSVDGCPHVRRALILYPFESPQSEHDRAADVSVRRLLQQEADGSQVVSKMSEETRLSRCAPAFSGFDDMLGRDQRAAQMLQALRSVGPWTLHIVDFPERAVLRHGAIIFHPSKAKNPTMAGADVAAHLAKELCSHIGDIISS
eukprot:TRINITY_DN7294_c1_g2_i1.p1 TRINITY_DN7294_c1_g2~~TRINITY_DN7294_c1_g2_i1.p1  ORF type:complete len:279 (-),score=19.22 TRINITY_DN7294_c1_g2_i1:557-1393(-)